MAKKKTAARRKTPAKSQPVVPTRVSIDITADGYLVIVSADRPNNSGVILSTREMVMQENGGVKGLRSGDVSDDLVDFPDLAGELRMTNSFHIAKCLRDLEGK